MARGRSVIVGGGLATSGALAVGALLYVVNVDPPTAAISPMMAQVTGANQGVIVSSNRADPQAAATQVLRVKGGAIIEGTGGTDSVQIGRGNTEVANPTDYIAIGLSTSIRGGSIAIGHQATAHGTNSDVTVGSTTFGAGNRNFVSIMFGNWSSTTGTGTGGGWVGVGSGTYNVLTTATDIVAIGTSITLGNTNGNIVIIGSNINSSTTASSVIIGSDASSSAGVSGSISIGPSNQVQHSSVILIGQGVTSTATGQCIIETNAGIDSLRIGKGDTAAAPAGLTFRLTNASNSADINGGDFTIVAGRGSGAGVPGAVQFAVGVQTGTSSVLQVQRTGAEVRFSSTATHTYLLIYDVDNAALERVTVGAADSGGAGFKVLRIPN